MKGGIGLFARFLSEHSFSEYKFRSDIFPSVEDRKFWDEFQNDNCVKLAEAEIDYDWPVIKATAFMEFKKSGNRQQTQKSKRQLKLSSLAAWAKSAKI